MNIKKVQILNLEAITKEEFAPYGQIWGREEEAPIEVLNNMKYYSNNVDLGPEIEQIDAGLLVCNSRGKRIEYFERHPETSESFSMIEGECIFVMAPVDNTQKKPDVSLIKAFYMNGNLGMALPAGNWHWPPIPIGETVKLLLVRKGTKRDPVDIVYLKDIGIDEILLTL